MLITDAASLGRLRLCPGVFPALKAPTEVIASATISRSAILPMELPHSGELGCPHLRRLVGQAVCQIGMNETKDQFMLLRPHHGEAGTEPPAFLGHSRCQIGSALIALIVFAPGDFLEAFKDGITHFLWNVIALPEAEHHRLHGVWSHGSI